MSANPSMTRFIPVLLLGMCASAQAASVNKCVVQGGRTVYSDKPCAAGQKSAPINAAMTSFSGSESSNGNRAGLARLSSGSAGGGGQVHLPSSATPATSSGYSSCPYR